MAKGRFYKPRKTQYGELKPSAYQIAKDYIERDGKLIGYITGYSAYNALLIFKSVQTKATVLLQNEKLKTTY